MAFYLLLIDDSKDDAFLLRRALQKAALDVEFVHVLNGEDAVDYLTRAKTGETVRPDVIILDLHMSGMNGFDLLNWMKAEAVTAIRGIIIYSSSFLPKDKSKALALGATAYVTKTPAGDALIQLLKSR